MAHFTTSNSVYAPSNTAFTALSSDSLIVDADAFLISAASGDGAFLFGSWDIIINGEVAALDAGHSGITINAVISDSVNITVGSGGDVYGYLAGLNLFSGIYTVVNEGAIGSNTYAIHALNQIKVTNTGTLDGDVLFEGIHDDTLTNFQKVGNLVKNGTVFGIIDLGDGADHFNGGAKSETVRDGSGADTYKFGGGNDVFLALPLDNGTDGTDTVNGGSGIDTYDASEPITRVFVNLDSRDHFPFSFLLPARTAVGNDIGTDNVIGFENATGGAHDDALYGSSGANVLIGLGGNDGLFGFGGRDILTGGLGVDTFFFEKLSDSGTTAATRDLITDFIPSDGDEIDLLNLEDSVGQTLTFIGFQHFHHIKGELHEVFSNGKTIVSGDVNGDGKADFSIALKGHVVLASGDFVL
jgi:Ca2+-binding RTX toxin-like protein